MKSIFVNNALFRILGPPIYGAIVYLLILLVNNSIAMLSESFFTEEVYISIGLTYLVLESNRFIAKMIERMAQSQERLGQLILKQVGINTLVTILLVSAAISGYFSYVLGFSNYQTELTYFNIIFVVTSWMYNLIIFSNYYLHRENEERMEVESSLRENIEKEFVSFKNDINPDLLYESLESLITLVHKDAVDAEDYIDRLSLAYRYILTNKQNELVSLEEDVRAARNLIFLLNVQNDDNITLDVQISSGDMDRQIIPGTLPGIVENIVRRSIINKDQPLSLQILIESDGYLIVQHKANEKLLPEKYDTGVVERLQSAYAYYSDKPVVEVEAYGESYIKIPALELSTEEIVI